MAMKTQRRRRRRSIKAETPEWLYKALVNVRTTVMAQQNLIERLERRMDRAEIRPALPYMDEARAHLTRASGELRKALAELYEIHIGIRVDRGRR